MKAPELSEERVVLVLRSARLLKVWVVAAEHVEIAAVGNTAVSTSSRGNTVS